MYEPHRSRRRPLSASELAQMGACERLIVWERRHGKQRTASQRQAIERGNVAHRRFFEDAVRADRGIQTSEKKPWCFIASATFGPAAQETKILRRFRDTVLRRSVSGRAFIHWYYRVSPTLCRAIAGRAALTRTVGWMLRPAVWLAKALCPRDRAPGTVTR